MPVNKYGSEDPEFFKRPEDVVTSGIELSPLFASVDTAADAEAARCACGQPAVTMRPVGREGDRTTLKGFCAACSEKAGEAEKREALKSLGKRRKKALEWLNGEMRSLYADRLYRDPETAWVTVVDARRAYRRYHDTIPDADLRFLGSLFRSRGWEKIPGKTAKNTDEGNHARPVECWRYVGGVK